jgi:hypothetical protein
MKVHALDVAVATKMFIGTPSRPMYGEADVEDDADSTYVPKPGFKIRATCFPERPDPT